MEWLRRVLSRVMFDRDGSIHVTGDTDNFTSYGAAVYRFYDNDNIPL